MKMFNLPRIVRLWFVKITLVWSAKCLHYLNEIRFCARVIFGSPDTID